MDRIFELSATSNIISQDFYPPIVLDQQNDYAIGLFSLSTYHTIPNIREGVNNEIAFVEKEGEQIETIALPTGSYELMNILDAIKEEAEKRDIEVELKLYKIPMKVGIMCEDYNILFIEDRPNLAKVLGFKSTSYDKAKEHMSEKVPQITDVNIINVECSLVGESYRNGRRSQTVYSFYPATPAGYKTIEQPTNILFIPVNVREISNISLRLTDHCGNLVDFQGELITIHLILRKLH